MNNIKWDGLVLPNFTLKEVKCSHCGLVILQPELLKNLHALRVEWDAPLVATSWTRCEEHNAAVGGKSNSYHLVGKAVDLKPLVHTETNMSELEAMAKRHFPFVLKYSTFIHCDIRGTRP